MTRAARTSTLAICLTLLSVGTAFPQTSSDATVTATPAAVHVAYVYVGTTKGVYLYNAASNGSLTLVSGSPYAIAGSAVAINGKYSVNRHRDHRSHGTLGRRRKEIYNRLESPT